MDETTASGFNLAFTLALVAGWAPALLARYAWKREPFKPTTATWIAGTWCFACFWIFREWVVNASDPEIMRNGLAWVFVFVFARMIMTRGYKERSSRLV